MHNNVNFPYIFPLFFVALWFTLLYIILQLSGWPLLAQYYTYQNQTVRKKGFQWANLRGISYKGCVTIGGNEQGLYLSIMPIFSAGAPSLFIPWQEIRISRRRYWWFQVLELSLTQTPSVKVMVFESNENFLQELYGKPLPIDETVKRL